MTDDVWDALRVQKRQYPPNVNSARVDKGVSAVFAEFEGTTWTEATLRLDALTHRSTGRSWNVRSLDGGRRCQRTAGPTRRSTSDRSA